MSVLRFAVTALVMALIAVALSALTPDLPVMTGALATAQRTADTAGPDALVLAAAGLLSWAVWLWGALGLALTAATALPGFLGGGARLLVSAVLPIGARRSAALVLGMGLGVAGPLLVPAVGLPVLPAASAAPSVSVVPDWPAAAPATGSSAAPAAGSSPALAVGSSAAPDWPAHAAAPSAVVPDWPAGDTHVVVRGDCLWHLAAGRLLDQLGRTPSGGEVAAAVQAWWTTNTDVIGSDPDLLLPGQVLRPPESP